MRFCALVLLALVAIAAAQQYNYTDDDKKKAQIKECMNKAGIPCQNGTEEEKQDCNIELDILYSCFDKCVKENRGNVNEIFSCKKSKCKSQNNDAQAFFDMKMDCLNTGINILAFTVIASTLALLF